MEIDKANAEAKVAKILIRLSPAMHSAAKEAAKREGKSLNRFCIDALIDALFEAASRQAG